MTSGPGLRPGRHGPRRAAAPGRREARQAGRLRGDRRRGPADRAVRGSGRRAGPGQCGGEPERAPGSWWPSARWAWPARYAGSPGCSAGWPRRSGWASGRRSCRAGSMAAGRRSVIDPGAIEVREVEDIRAGDGRRLRRLNCRPGPGAADTLGRSSNLRGSCAQPTRTGTPIPRTSMTRDLTSRDVKSQGRARARDERRWAALAALAPGTDAPRRAGAHPARQHGRADRARLRTRPWTNVCSGGFELDVRVLRDPAA